MPVEIFAARRKYNRLPLDEATRITLLQRKDISFPAPGEGGFGQCPDKNLGRGMPERRGALFKGRPQERITTAVF